MKRFSNRAGQQGLSLIELMIALVLGLLVVAAVIQLFLGTRVTYGVTSGLARVQENARFALEVMNRDIRMAGAGPVCGGRLPLQTEVYGAIGNNFIFANGVALTGWEFDGTASGNVAFDPQATNASLNSWTPAAPAFLDDLAMPGSDILAITRTESIPNIQPCSNNNNLPNINICPAPGTPQPGRHNLAVGDLFAAIDCRGFMDICRHSSASTSTLICSESVGNWQTLYTAGTEIHRVFLTHYYVGESASGGGRRALFRTTNCPLDNGNCPAERREELVEGVESLQLFYRVAGNNNLLTANQVANWADVRAVVMNLVVASPDDVDARALQQNVALDNGLVFQINDRRVRQVYSNTVVIRNSVTVH
ncbi:MAG: PilW family protein [Wenzhouxiangella sp.]